MKNALLNTLFCLLTTAGFAQGRKADLAAMQGVWQSDVDKNAWLLVEDSLFVMCYKQGKNVEAGKFRPLDSCCKRCTAFRVTINSETNCYELLEVSNEKLVYSFLTRSNTHSYVKRKKLPKSLATQWLAMKD